MKTDVRIEIVSATRLPAHIFWAESPLGLSLRRLECDQRITHRVAFSNQRGLPEIYNRSIEADFPGSLLVFVHDDVWLEDIFFVDRIVEGLKHFDVIGVAGSRRRVHGQPAWAFPNLSFAWDSPENLSGCVAHGRWPFGQISQFGAVPAECELLDGVLLAVRRSTLLDAGVAFDPRFTFHFYDMDFCRTARRARLRLGTWPISVTHQSGGAFNTPAWEASYQEYLRKWDEAQPTS